MVSKEEFLDWKQQDVTKAFFEAANVRVEEAKEVLSYEAGKDSDTDTFWRGFIYAYRELQDFHIDEEN